MPLIVGQIVLFLLMFGSFLFLSQPSFLGVTSPQKRRWFHTIGAVLLGATFAWAFYLGSARMLYNAVIRI